VAIPPSRVTNDLVKIATSLGYRLAPRNDYNTLSPLRRSADALLLAMTIILFRPYVARLMAQSE